MVPARWLGILAVALLAFSAASVLGAGGGGGAVDVKKSTCWTCHSAWTPPLKQSANLIPGDPVSADVGKPLAYAMQIQNAWRHEIRAYTLTVDLAAAPSLNFASGAAPIKDKVVPLTIPGVEDPANPGAPALMTDRQVETKVDLPVPASSSHLTIAPQDATPTGRTLTGLVTAPDGSTKEYPSGGPGQAIDIPDPFTGKSGPFQVGAKVSPPTPGPSLAPPAVGAVPFTVKYSAAFELDGLRQVPYSVPTFLDKGKIQLFGGINFTVAKEPAAGEHVRFWFNSTVHYKHTNTKTQGGDWANWTQAPVDVPVVLTGSKVELLPTSTGPIVRIPPLNGPTLTTVSEAIGYASAFLIVSSIASGGMFGKASRRGMNHLFGSAKRRVAFHNVLSYGIILVAAVHMVLFLIDGDYKWTRGIIWGGLSILAMFGLGVTGALQVPMIRRWNYGAWRWTHYGMTVAVIVLTLLHMLLEGAHFGSVQGALHYSDPFNRVRVA